MTSKSVRLILGFLTATVGWQLSLFAEEAINLQPLERHQPAFYVRASLDRSRPNYVKDDLISLKVTSEKDAHLYVMYHQADGILFQIFPNSIHKKSFVKGGESVTLGGQGDSFRWKVAPPFGRERIAVIASSQPILELSTPAQISQPFNPVSAKQLRAVAAQLGDKEWSSASVELTTSSAMTPLKSVSRRLGLFIGVAKHFYADEEAESYRRLKEQNPRLPEFAGTNVPGPDNSAKMLAKLMKREGNLDDMRVLTNEFATRDAIKESLTRWLPKATSDGDTVFVYYSGKTSQIADDNGDEKDHLDEIMMCYDSLSPLAFSSFVSRLDGNNQGPEKQRHANRLLAKLARSGIAVKGEIRGTDRERGRHTFELAMKKSNAELRRKVFDFLVRETSIPDDELGHWLQYLDGRHVVVILDTCHAGGYANIEKTLMQPQVAPLDLLDSEVTRLKDIGQRDLAIMGSSSVTQESRLIEFRPEAKLPVMGRFSAFICFGLMEVPAPASVADLYSHVNKAMNEFNQKLPAAQRHNSRFFDDLTRPIYIKP